MSVTNSDNSLIMFVNGAGVAIAYGMLGISLWLSTNVPLATKGFWGMAVLLLTLSLINFVIISSERAFLVLGLSRVI